MQHRNRCRAGKLGHHDAFRRAETQTRLILDPQRVLRARAPARASASPQDRFARTASVAAPRTCPEPRERSLGSSHTSGTKDNGNGKLGTRLSARKIGRETMAGQRRRKQPRQAADYCPPARGGQAIRRARGRGPVDRRAWIAKNRQSGRNRGRHTKETPMLNFTYYNPTRIVFGKGTIAELQRLVPQDNKVLLLFGGGSIRRNGVYDQVRPRSIGTPWSSGAASSPIRITRPAWKRWPRCGPKRSISCWPSAAAR